MRPSSISIRHLRYFDALSQHRHFGRAAEACSISQPALSLQMKELEELLGVALIERGNRQIRLTSVGEAFEPRVREILRAVDELGELARASASPLGDRLRIGMIPTVAPYLLPSFAKRISEDFPDLELRPREAVTQKLIEDLLDGRLDAAVVALPVSEPSLHERLLFNEEFVLVRPWADRDKPVPCVEMLQKMRLLLLEEGHCFRDQALSFCKLSPSSARELMEGSSLSTLVQMVGAGLGVTLIPSMAVPNETASARVSVAKLDTPRPVRSIGMVWRKTNPLAAGFSKIADILHEEYVRCGFAESGAEDTAALQAAG